jgi:hypothetical protein
MYLHIREISAFDENWREVVMRSKKELLEALFLRPLYFPEMV